MSRALVPEGRISRGNAKSRLVIVDDHPIMLHGLKLLLNAEPDLEVCAQASTAEEAMVATGLVCPDLVLLDLCLPDKHGLELIKDMRLQFPRSRILVLSMHEESLYAERVLRAGARGYLMKISAGRELVKAIHKVLDGGIYLSQEMSDCMLELVSGKRRPSTHSALDRLTDREMEVFQLIGSGKSSREIASSLGVSIRTIDAHRAHLKEKLQLGDGMALIRKAANWLQGQVGGN